MDPFIDLGRFQKSLSAIRHNPQSREIFLAPLYHSGSPARCLCSDTPIEMGVARRRDKVPVFYLYHLHRGDPTLHHPRCPHRIEYEGSVGQTASEAATVNLNQPGEEGGGLVVHTPLLEPRRIKPMHSPALVGLPALLEAVLLISGLNAWHPGFISHRSYSQARYRLLEAARKIRPYGATTLADVLFMPPIWNEGKRDEIEGDWQGFLDLMQPTEECVPRGVVMGRLRSINVKPEWSAPMLKLSEWRHAFWLDACPRLITEGPSENMSWLVMLAVEMSPTATKLRVIDGAAMRITPQWLPVFTVAHAHFANDLVQQKTSFTTSLHTDPATSWATPDFVVSSREGQARKIFPRRE